MNDDKISRIVDDDLPEYNKGQLFFLRRVKSS